MLKHYYRLVYWKRRITRALGWRRGIRADSPGAYGRGPGAGRRPGRARQLVYSARPLLVFGVLVAIVVAASAVAGGGYDDFGWAGP
ncbi:hypothetical protein ACFW1M_20820 [Streptomyces inhibens]|uniref:hypothetical protein n=1 Tax=Streptomyces inhibens TaxID=2293571 RepID=UPI0036AF3E9A